MTMPRNTEAIDLLAQIPCAVLVSDLSGRILFANTAFSDLTGLHHAPGQQHNINDVLPPAGRIFLQTHVFPLLHKDGRVSEISLTLMGATGNRVSVLLNCCRGAYAAETAYWWVFMASTERAKFEANVIAERNRAQAAAAELGTQKRFLQTITDSVPSLIGYWDRDLKCQFANAVYMQWFVGQPQSVQGKSMQELLGTQGYGERKAHALQALAGQAQVFEVALTDEAGNRRFHIADYIPDVQTDGSIAGFFSLISDVTKIVEAQSELRLAAAIVQASVNGIMVIDGNGRIASVNPAFTDITGFSAGEAIGQTANFMETLYTQDPETPGVGAQRQARHFSDGEAWCRNKWGATFVMKHSVSLIPGGNGLPDRSAIVFHDETARWKQQQLDTHLALHDTLTDLPNRALLAERLGQLIQASARSDRWIAIMFLDLDGFKAVNDSLGHDAGDVVLRVIAQRLFTLVRQADTVARMGGDEFVVMLDGPTSHEEIETIAQRIIDVVGEPIAYENQLVSVGASVGIVVLPQDSSSPSDALKLADSAMYRAKNAGKNTYRFASPLAP